MQSYQGKTALITGASSGIGAVFARHLAEREMNLVLVARSQDTLQTLADELQAQHHIRADVLPADLSNEYAAQAVYNELQTRGLHVDMLVNNAGFGTHGSFAELPLEKQHREVMLNVTTVVDLTHLLLPPMLARRDGAVINVASVAGFQPVPYMAVYGATKAFVLSFSEALWAEYRSQGVRVLALCPGATDTAFFAAANTEKPPVGPMITPEAVVTAGLRALERGRSHVVPHWQVKLLSQSARFVPREAVLALGQRMFKPRRTRTSSST